MATTTIDLRSDTVTQPTPEMRQSAFEAIVGDDGMGEDPTVTLLEASFAARVGKEAAVFVPSGVMANQIALRILTRPGDTVAAGRRQHVVGYELGAAGRNASIQFQILDDALGTFDLNELVEVLEGDGYHLPSVTALFVENTHMASGGRTWPIEQLRRLPEIAQGRPIHLDGARLFNAEVATGVSAVEICASATTVSACLSKGLSAPVGSVLAGPAELMAEARVERKRLGGAMRQGGIIAAPALLGLNTMVERLAEDHRRAQIIREAVAQRFPDVAASLEGQATNIVVFPHPEVPALLASLASKGILAGPVAPGVVRFVTHRHIDDAMAEQTAEVVLSL